MEFHENHQNSPKLTKTTITHGFSRKSSKLTLTHENHHNTWNFTKTTQTHENPLKTHGSSRIHENAQNFTKTAQTHENPPKTHGSSRIHGAGGGPPPCCTQPCACPCAHVPRPTIGDAIHRDDSTSQQTHLPAYLPTYHQQTPCFPVPDIACRVPDFA